MLRSVLVFALWCGVTSAAFAQGQEREIPHYFPDGIETITVPSRQYEAYLRYLNAIEVCLGYPWHSRTFDNSITVERKIEGENVRFIFDPWVRSGDSILFYDFCGQVYVSDEQFKVVVEDFIDQFRSGGNTAFAYYEDLERRAVRARADAVGMSEADFRKTLGERVPEAPSVTYRELQQLPPEMKRSDFVPREIHLGYGFFLGAAWLNSGVIYVTLQGRVLDQLIGKPQVMTHEIIHANTSLQSYPLSEGIDLELMASIPEMLLPEDKLAFIYHFYMRDVREMAWVFFGFNFEQVRDEVVLFNHAGNVRLDAQKFDEYAGKLEEIKEELLRFFREEALPAYYHDRIFASSLNEKLWDRRGIFRVIMALNYDPTILGGHEETMVWLEAHRSEIERMAHEAFQESGRSSGGEEFFMQGEEESDSVRVYSLAAIQVLEQISGRNQKELLELARKYNLTEEDVRGKSLPELLQLFLTILEWEQQGERR